MFMPQSLRRVTLLVCSAALLSACAGTAAVPTAAPAPLLAPTTPPTAAPPTAAPTVAPTAAPPTVAPTTLPTAAPPTAAPTVAPITSDPITGAPAFARGAITRRPFVIMIDNHPAAYPQLGLDKAAIVFESLAEFGLTRFMAVYAPGISPEADAIGPVRSARLYFVQWAMGFGAMYVHAGGSPESLALVAETDTIVNLDALFGAQSGYFERSPRRDAPHNLFTSSAELERAAAAIDTATFARDDVGFAFKPDAPESARPESQRLVYFFLYQEDSAGWEYDRQTNSYLRLRRGQPAQDGVTGEQLRAKNVVVMEVREAPIPGDDKGRIEQQVVGEGRARLFMDGVEREVLWRKSTPEAPLGFFEAGGAEVQLNAGSVWIVALPELDNLTVE
jgi:hypothetical protein